MPRTWIRPLALVFCLLGFESVVAAQCPTPDGLSFGPCCTSVTPTLPRLQDFSHGAFQICWRDCDVDAFSSVTAEWRGPGSIVPFGGPFFGALSSCGDRLSGLTLTNAAGTVLWRGLMRLLYSRTWQETDASGGQVQVWRFLVNGDMIATSAAGLSPCPVPPCQAAFGKVRFTGYIDYAETCSTGNVETAWMLTHGCDLIDHAPNFPRSGFFHPNHSYTFVGPSAGFAICPIQPAESGSTTVGSVRRRKMPAPGTFGPILCEFREQIDAGLQLQQELCLCGGSPFSPFQWAISDLGLGAFCATSIFTPGGPFLPGFMSMGLGTWTDPTRYPGLETLRWSGGGYDYFDPCMGVTRQEVFFGVTTLGGYAASDVDFPFPLPLTFVDQANSINNGATVMNVPFQSDHIISLNFP